MIKMQISVQIRLDVNWPTGTELGNKNIKIIYKTGCLKNTPLWVLLNFSGHKHARRLEHISFAWPDP